jgi:hypothetical protein
VKYTPTGLTVSRGVASSPQHFQKLMLQFVVNVLTVTTLNFELTMPSYGINIICMSNMYNMYMSMDMDIELDYYKDLDTDMDVYMDMDIDVKFS